MSSFRSIFRLTTADAVAPLALAAVAAALSAAQAGGYLLREQVTVPDAVVSVAPDAAGIGRAGTTGLATVALTDPGIGPRLALAGAALLPGVLVLLGGWVLYHLLASMVAGRAFTDANLRRLHLLTGLLVAAGTVVPILDGIVRAAVLSTPDTPQLSMSISMAPIVGAICTSTAALAFRRGKDLEDDVEGLV